MFSIYKKKSTKKCQIEKIQNKIEDSAKFENSIRKFSIRDTSSISENNTEQIQEIAWPTKRLDCLRQLMANSLSNQHLRNLVKLVCSNKGLPLIEPERKIINPNLILRILYSSDNENQDSSYGLHCIQQFDDCKIRKITSS